MSDAVIIPEQIKNMAYKKLLKCLPAPFLAKLRAMEISSRGFIESLSEIRLRVGNVSSITLSGRAVPIRVNITADEVRGCLDGLIGGQVHLHRDSLLRGYFTMEPGIRVGIGGTVSYEKGVPLGIAVPRLLNFRLPFYGGATGKDIAELLTRDGVLHSALIFSPPGGGKTTALRMLAFAIDKIRYTRIVVVDERREFSPEVYIGTGIDILSGHEKSYGIELAARLLNPEIILIDEIATEAEARALRGVMNVGVPVVATTHARAADELRRKPGLRELVEDGYFDFLIGIERRCGDYMIKAESGINKNIR